MKTIIAVIIISIMTAVAVNAQSVKSAAAVQNVAGAASQQNSVHEGTSDVQSFVVWKDKPVTAPPPMDAKARYDAFLRSKGVDPNVIGVAKVVNGRMFVPTIEEQYAARPSKYRALNPALPGATNFPRRPDWWYIPARPSLPLYTSQ
jgi:hypothetical protein